MLVSKALMATAQQILAEAKQQQPQNPDAETRPLSLFFVLAWDSPKLRPPGHHGRERGERGRSRLLLTTGACSGARPLGLPCLLPEGQGTGSPLNASRNQEKNQVSICVLSAARF